MKKIKNLFAILLFVFLLGVASYSTVPVLAEETDGELPAEAVVEDTAETDENVVVEETETEKSLSPEELKEIVNTVLSEQQKEQAEKTANIIAERFNLNATTVYIVLVVGLIIVFLIVFLVGKIIAITRSKAKTSEKLLALQATLSDKIVETENLTEALKSLDKDKISDAFSAVVKPVIDDIKPEIIKSVGDNLSDVIKGFTAEIIKGVGESLQLDKNVMQKVLGETATTSEQVSVITKALEVLALKSNQTEMANVLTKAPTAEAYAEVVFENQKLKAALGEEAVNKVIEK